MPRHLCKEHFAAYNNVPWRLAKLSYIGYETGLAYSVGNISEGKSFEKIKQTSTFRELHAFLTAEFIQQPVDSIQIFSGLEYYDPESHSLLVDTTFFYTYHANSIGNAKK